MNLASALVGILRAQTLVQKVSRVRTARTQRSGSGENPVLEDCQMNLGLASGANLAPSRENLPV